METVPADTVFLIVLIGDGIHICLGRHGGMEGSIKYHDFRNIFPKYLFAGKDTIQFRAVVQRRQRNQAADSLDHLVVDQNGFAEFGTALCNAMSNGADFVQILDDAHLGVGQCLRNMHKCIRVILHGHLHPLAAAVGRFMNKDAAVHTDSFAIALGQHPLAVHVDQLVLQRRTTGVNNQNFHWKPLLLFYSTPSPMTRELPPGPAALLFSSDIVVWIKQKKTLFNQFYVQIT